jgi:cell division protein FtsB
MANLEESQQQCQKLMAHISNGKIDAEKEQLEKNIQKLQVNNDYVEVR